MDIVHTISELRSRLAGAKAIAFVPTMGHLHAGHIDLIRVARVNVGESGQVVTSIFVNRLQFGANEDFDKYPRSFKEDCEQCRQAGVDIVFVPDEVEMYPEPQTCAIELPDIQHILDGVVRPGHFRGVATVVMKLFNMVQPSVAVFGKKDYQQCRVLLNMVRQFNLPIEMVLVDTMRAADGLALSSRNAYLTVAERIEAPQLYAVLGDIKSKLLAGSKNYDAIETEALNYLQTRGWQPDYITIRCRLDLLQPTISEKTLVILAAARLGTTRLIDNVEVLL